MFPCSRTISKKGLTLNISSFAGAAPTLVFAVYVASKAFLRAARLVQGSRGQAGGLGRFFHKRLTIGWFV